MGAWLGAANGTLQWGPVKWNWSTGGLYFISNRRAESAMMVSTSIRNAFSGM